MHSKHRRLILQRQALNKLLILVNTSNRRHHIHRTLRKLELFAQNFRNKQSFQISNKANSIPIISNPSSIIDMSSHKKHTIPRNLVLFFQKHFQNLSRSFQIRIVEFIPDVPTQRSEFPSHLYNSVEISKTPYDFMKRILLSFGASL